MVFYSNSDSVLRTNIDTKDWGVSPNVNFSILWSMRNQKRNGKYEFYIYDSSTIKRNIIFNQTNAYNESPLNNSFTKKSGNFYYSSNTNYSTWFGLALGNYGTNPAMISNCTLAMASDGSSWTYCLQDQFSGTYNTGPWFSDTNINPSTGYDLNSQQWVKIFQR